jgi:hypothetical protein
MRRRRRGCFSRTGKDRLALMLIRRGVALLLFRLRPIGACAGYRDQLGWAMRHWLQYGCKGRLALMLTRRGVALLLFRLRPIGACAGYRDQFGWAMRHC